MTARATNPASGTSKAPALPVEVAPDDDYSQHASTQPGLHSNPQQVLPPVHNFDHDLDFHILEPLCSVFRRKLKAEGLKYTPERAQILETVIRLGTTTSTPGRASLPAPAFHADRILADVQTAGFNVSKATMYRTLKLLLDAHILERVLGDGDQIHFRFTYGNTLALPHTPHATNQHPIASHHLHRTDTGHAAPIDDPSLETLTRTLRDLCAQHGLAYEGHRLEVRARAQRS